MKLKDVLEKLGKSKTFQEWQKSNKKCYLSHVFIMLGEKEDCQVGYYNKEKDKITSFIIDEKIEVSQESDIFKKDRKIVEKLDIDKVKIDFEDAVKIANKFQRENYTKEIPIKKIIVLQNLEIGQVWNITYISNSFNTLNIKIDAKTGKIKNHEIVSLFSFGKAS